MGITKAASIASVVEYGRSGRLIVPWLEHRESPQVGTIELCSLD